MRQGERNSALVGGRVAVERLEGKRLMAASVAGVLKVRVTEGADETLVALNGGDSTRID